MVTGSQALAETYMFLEFQKHQAQNICQQYLNMSAVHLCTI